MMLLNCGIVLLVGYCFGELAGKCKLPKLVGMILAGICLGPYGLNQLSDSFLGLSSDIRQIALIIILMRAGLTLQFSDLVKIGRPAFLMCFVPACFELAAVGWLAPLFFDISRADALVMGAVLAAVSPAVVVPRMIRFIQLKKGQKHLVPQVVLAGASADDVFVVVCFSSFLLYATTNEMQGMNFLSIPMAIGLGSLVGYGVGKGLSYIEQYLTCLDSSVLLFLFSSSFILVSLEKMLEGFVPFSGLLAILVMTLTFHHSSIKRSLTMSHMLNQCWFFGEIFLFVLVGTSVDLTILPQIGLLSIVFVGLACCIRLLGVFVCFIRTPFTLKERFFCMISYCPKATVQAAIGGVPLAMGMASGEIILVVAVIAILFTAPVGAYMIDHFGPCLLADEN